MLPPPWMRRLGLGLAGFGLGGFFLWLALGQFDRAQFATAIAAIDNQALVEACLLYWLGLALRVVRWSTLLAEIRDVNRLQVAETLLVGYAVNNVLPARLGEVFRADYAKRRFGMGRATVLGSIVVERLLDLCAILCCLALGLAASGLRPARGDMLSFELIALNAALLIGALLFGIRYLAARDLRRLPLPRAAVLLLEDLRRGFGSLNGRSRSAVMLLSAAVWACEVAALWAVCRSLGVSLSLDQALLLMGAASLSTLVPTAPGYLGTYQLVFVLALDVFDQPATLGVAASSLIQIVLFGSVTAIGLAIYLVRSINNMRLVKTRASIRG